MKLAGKVAIITGAAAGIGRATAEFFAREEAQVVVADIDAEGAAVRQGALGKLEERVDGGYTAK